MKPQLLLITLLFLYAQAITAQNVQWSNHLSSVNDNVQSGMVMDDAGNSYITGRFFDNMMIAGEELQHESPAGTYVGNIYLAKIDDNGEHVWSSSAVPDDGVFDNAKFTNIGIDAANNIYVTGLFQGSLNWEGESVTNNHNFSYFMAKFDSNGNLQWLKKSGYTEAEFVFREFEDVAVSDNGAVYAAGRFRDTVYFDGQIISTPNMQAYYLVKFNPDGTLDWSHTIDRLSENRWPSLTLDTYNEDVLITGAFSKEITIDDHTISPEGSEENLFVARLNDAGQSQWVENLHSETDGTNATTVNTAINGNIFIGGSALSDLPDEERAILIAEIDENGQHQWHQKYEVENQRFFGIDPVVSGIEINNESEVYFAGYVNNGGTVNFDNFSFLMETAFPDGYAVKLDENREASSLIYFQGTSDDDEARIFNMELYQDSLVNLFGSFRGSLTGDLELNSTDDSEDGFLAMFEHEICPVAFFNVPSDGSGCQEETFTFENHSFNADTFTWLVNGDTVENAEADLEYSFDMIADYEIKLIVEYRGCVDEYSTEFNINLNPPVDLGPDTTITDGDSYQLDAGGFGSDFTWIHNGDTTEETGQFFNVTKEGFYIAIAESIHGCTGRDSVQIDVVSSLLQDQYSPVNMSVYPNPADNKLTVEFSDYAPGFNLHLYDMTGRKVLSKNPDHTRTVLDIADIDRGIYKLKLYHGQTTISSQKIIKK